MLPMGIERDTYISVFSPNAGKHWPSKVLYSWVFYPVFTFYFSEEPKSNEQIRLEQSLYPKTASHYIYPDEDYLHSGTSFQRVNGPKRNYFIIHPDFVSENTGRRLLDKKKLDKRYFGESKVAYWYIFCDLNCLGCWDSSDFSKRFLQENKARQIFQKTNISDPLIRTRACAYQGIRNVSFSENLACFVFL